MKTVKHTDSAFVDQVMVRVRAASSAEDDEELFPGVTTFRSVPVTLGWGERAAAAACVTAAALFLALRVAMLGSILAGSCIDESPSGISPPELKEGNHV